MKQTIPTIRKGIPIPPAGRKTTGGGRTGIAAYPFSDMQVGDMFFVPCKKNELAVFYKRSRVIASANNYGIKVTTRVMNDPFSGKYGLGVWRNI